MEPRRVEEPRRGFENPSAGSSNPSPGFLQTQRLGSMEPRRVEEPKHGFGNLGAGSSNPSPRFLQTQRLGSMEPGCGFKSNTLGFFLLFLCSSISLLAIVMLDYLGMGFRVLIWVLLA
ncbi:hypothetical protein SLEP1_g54612 [Rubroshorea leprosula]|uniref:Uncharacterized protein n=1 Tax=Rubroshorea leprosula TaxID=152421 RepID=A0AAV5MF33_9ROSI|nr:hypothetical protein SLEP1_g54612 [Rubroshorea leprosula]